MALRPEEVTRLTKVIQDAFAVAVTDETSADEVLSAALTWMNCVVIAFIEQGANPYRIQMGLERIIRSCLTSLPKETLH